MALPVILSRAANRHLEALSERYRALGGERLVQKLEEEIAAVIQRIRQFPASSAVWEGQTRRTLTARLRLSVYYRATPEFVQIVSITDQRRNPRSLRFK